MRVRTAVAVMLMLVLGCVAAAPATAAEEPNPPATATTPTESGGGTTEPEPAGGTTTTPSEPAATTTTTSTTNDDDNRGIAIVIFILGAFAIVLAYFFYDGWRKSYETLALSSLKTTGKFPDTIFNPVEQAQFTLRALGEAGEAPPAQPVVTGPTAVAVEEKATYSATVDGAPADSCTWTVEPTDAATVEPATGARVTVTPSKEGPLKLTAKIGDGDPTIVNIAVVAAAQGGGVPLLGIGFAGFAAALTAIAIAGGLTVLGVLGSEAFIAFLGPLLGYFFARGRETGQPGPETA